MTNTERKGKRFLPADLQNKENKTDEKSLVKYRKNSQREKQNNQYAFVVDWQLPNEE